MIKHIVAKSLNDVIGIDNGLPWHLPEDLKLFKELTLGKTIYMGSNTFRSVIGYAKSHEVLPGRNIVVITQNPVKAQQLIDDYGLDSNNISYWTKPILDHYIKANPNEEILIVGGEKVYEAYPPDEVIATVVNIDIENGNKFYNHNLNTSEFKLVSQEDKVSSTGISFSIKKYVKVKVHG